MYGPDNRPQALWRGEELEVTFTGDPMQADYDVPGSPTWTEIENITIEEIEILGVRVRPEALPKELLEKLHALSDQLEW